MYQQLPGFPYGLQSPGYPPYGMQSTLRYSPPSYYPYAQLPSYLPQQYFPQQPSYYPYTYINPPVGPQNLRNSYFPQPAQRTQPQPQVNYTSRLLQSPQSQNQIQTVQSPQKQKGLSYEEVMQRIQESQKKSTVPSTKVPPQAPQQEVQPQAPQTKPKEAAPQTQKTTQPQQKQQQKPQQKPAPPKPQPEQKPADDLDKRFAEAIQRTKQIVHQINKGQDADAEDQKQTQPQRKVEPEPPAPQEEAESEDLDELALQYEDGFIYRGHGYQPATRHGYGVLTDAEDNVVYEGSWANNVYDGEGKLNNLQQDQLDGPIDWNNMSTIGNGWANYEGSFQQGKMHGYGQLILTNGEKYLGEFIEGMIEGQGEFYTLNGDAVKGFWQNGLLTQE